MPRGHSDAPARRPEYSTAARQQLILDALEQGPAIRSVLAALVGCDAQDVTNALRGLLANGQVVRGEAGLYTLGPLVGSQPPQARSAESTGGSRSPASSVAPDMPVHGGGDSPDPELDATTPPVPMAYQGEPGADGARMLIRVDHGDAAWVWAIAAATERDPGDVVREALRWYVRQWSEDEARPRDARGFAEEVIRDLVASFVSHPEALLAEASAAEETLEELRRDLSAALDRTSAALALARTFIRHPPSAPEVAA